MSAGNAKQRDAYKVLVDSNVMGLLTGFDPILTGTIPIAIDIDSSDLDIICCFAEPESFIECVKENFGTATGFRLRYDGDESNVVVANFFIGSFEIELFGQPIPTAQQNAYLHMLTEWRVLEARGAEFQNEIIALKKSGLKTELAFAKLLGLAGNPYESLLAYGRDNGYI